MKPSPAPVAVYAAVVDLASGVRVEVTDELSVIAVSSPVAMTPPR
jgi:hypothetical protein